MIIIVNVSTVPHRFISCGLFQSICVHNREYRECWTDVQVFIHRCCVVKHVIVHSMFCLDWNCTWYYSAVERRVLHRLQVLILHAGALRTTSDSVLEIITYKQRCSLETLVLVSRRLEDMKNGLGLGLGLDEKVSTFSRPWWMIIQIAL